MKEEEKIVFDAIKIAKKQVDIAKTKIYPQDPFWKIGTRLSEISDEMGFMMGKLESGDYD